VSFFVIVLRRGMKFSSTSASPGMEMPPKKAAIIQDEADGNPQPFREFHSITQRHRGGGGDCLLCGACCHHVKEVENVEDTSNHHGR
jgi:hypothetical protein